MALENVTVFLIHSPTRNLDDYRATAEQACKLKPYGQVHMNVSTLASKSFHEIPAGGSPWHEYACNNPTPAKFFPHEMVKPFIPAEFVAKNRELLLAKAKILREVGLDAAFWSYEPNYLPEEFFEAYPHMRGPRVDHPRRSRQEAFSPCLAVPETREMLSWQVAELIRNVPEIKTYFFKTNDAGPGICWSDNQYAGPNGPTHCRGRTMGQRVRDLLDAINKGAEMGGGEFRIHFTGNLSNREYADIERNLPDNAFSRQPRLGRAATISIGGSVDSCYPFRGIVDGLQILRRVGRIADGKPRTVFVSFRPSYDRGYERPDAVAKVFDMAADCLADPPVGLIQTLQRLEKWCNKWAGDSQGQKLFDAMVNLQEAFKAQRALGRMRMGTWTVSLRHATRPLLAVPGYLTEQEESYWLPYVFNISVEEARQDYIDVHGGRAGAVNIPAGQSAIRQIRGVCRILDGLDDCPEKALLGRMSTSLKMYCCFLQSAMNFYSMQVIRDRNKEKLAEVARPSKESTWTGDTDLLAINELMRNELDSTHELIDLLNDGGMELICHAEDPAEEDTFLLGPDLVEQLRKKCRIMRRHWLDAEKHHAAEVGGLHRPGLTGLGLTRDRRTDIMDSKQTVFVIRTLIADIDEFTAVAEQAARLKEFGRVEMTISALAGKARYEMPSGGNAWHEYANFNPALHKFFPHEKIAPFIPADYVQSNRRALDERLAVIRRLGLGASFWANEPSFLPEAFFEAYPHLRGPRVDHPRRSRHEEFAPCIDHAENLEMYAWMAAQLAKCVPELGTFAFKTNDAGSGICWADWLYPGPNGPAHCRSRTIGQRVAGLMAAFRDGATQGGADVKVILTPQFRPDEMQEIARLLPDNCLLGSRGRTGGKLVSIGCSQINDCYPTKGILSALPIVKSASTIKSGTGQTVVVAARVYYNRDVELTDVWKHTFDIVAGCVDQPVSGLMPTLDRLGEQCRQWVGPDSADALREAMVDLDDVLKLQRVALRPLSTMYLGVSLRHMTRPLVAVPGYLTGEEEDHWLKHVFNIWQDEARDDYLDLHGGHWGPVSDGVLDAALGKFESIAGRLARIGKAAGDGLFEKMSTALRIHASVLRSCGNFYRMQLLRDRNKEKLAEVTRPPKKGTWTGDTDLLKMNALMRDELDNTEQLIDLLADGGMEMVCHAKDPADEDTFLLGPDLVEQLRKKCRIMRRHWLDAEKHPPLK